MSILAVRKAFTLIELIVALSIIGIVAALGMISIPGFQSQMKSSEEIRRLGLTINSLRNEAIRQRASITLSFNDSGYSWDIGADGTNDGSYTFEGGVRWAGTVPAAVTINGLGLTRGIASSQDFSVRSGDTVLTLTLNSNGFVSF